jgi:tetratricopeptide (TPR) repeat protein
MTYVAPILSMDFDDALEALRALDDNTVSEKDREIMAIDAVRTVASVFDIGLEIDADEDDDDDNSGLVNLDHLAWALTQARLGQHAEALDFITRALEPFPDAVAALDIIRRKLTP